MLHRVLSLFLLLSFPSLYPGDVVTFVVHGIKNIVIPAVTAAAAGAGSKSSFSRRSRDAFFVESMVESRGVAKGVQSTNIPIRYDSSSNPVDYISNPQYTAAGVPTHNSDGTPNEEFFREQERRSKQLFQQNNQPQKKGGRSMTIEEIKAENAAKGTGGGNNGPNKDPKKDPQSDPTKFRREKASDRRHDNPLPDPRKGGQTGKDLKFPTKDNPGQYSHQFRAEKGHFQELTNKARAALWDCFEKGRFLGQDETGGFNFDYIDPQTGYQVWMRTRPDGKVIDCGVNTVHWGLSKYGFLDKPHDLSQELAEGVYYADTVLNSPVTKTAAVVLAAEEWRKESLQKIKDKEMSDFLGNVASGFEKRSPTAKEIQQRAEADKFSQLEYEAARKKIELARLPKPNPNATIEIARPAPRIDEVQPKREKAESSGGSSSSSSSTSSVRLSDSKISEIIANAGPRQSFGGSSMGSTGSSSFASGPIASGSMGGIKIGGSGSYLPGTFGNLPSSSKFDDDDDDFDDMLDDDDDDDDWQGCHGLGCR